MEKKCAGPPIGISLLIIEGEWNKCITDYEKQERQKHEEAAKKPPLLPLKTILEKERI